MQLPEQLPDKIVLSWTTANAWPRAQTPAELGCHLHCHAMYQPHYSEFAFHKFFVLAFEHVQSRKYGQSTNCCCKVLVSIATAPLDQDVLIYTGEQL